MAFVEEHHPGAVPFFALCLFAGIRPCLRLSVRSGYTTPPAPHDVPASSAAARARRVSSRFRLQAIIDRKIGQADGRVLPRKSLKKYDQVVDLTFRKVERLDFAGERRPLDPTSFVVEFDDVSERGFGAIVRIGSAFGDVAKGRGFESVVEFIYSQNLSPPGIVPCDPDVMEGAVGEIPAGMA
jgi:hypothetical protein